MFARPVQAYQLHAVSTKDHGATRRCVWWRIVPGATPGRNARKRPGTRLSPGLFGIMSIITRLSLTVALQTLGVPWAIADGFVFADMSLKTTVEQLRHRYPTSKMVGNYLYVAPSESRDHIYGIQLPGSGRAGVLKLFFEHSDAASPTRAPEYPGCNDVASKLKATYGSPDATEEFSEERASNRRLIWKRAGEALVLHCFRLDGTRFLAETLTIERAVQ